MTPVHGELLEPNQDQYRVLEAWIRGIARLNTRVLDIGAGDGDDEYTRLIRPLVTSMTGVEPGQSAPPGSLLDDWFVGSIQQFVAASGPSGSTFDIAMAIYVLEHIQDPLGFFLAARSCLEPGGSLFVITPNLWHYFGIAAKTATALGADDAVLKFLRNLGHRLNDTGEAPKGHSHTHTPVDHRSVAHFDVAYRANSIRALQRLASAAGFSRIEFKHLENPAIFRTYFPGRSARFAEVYSMAVNRFRRPELYGTLICRLVN